MGEGRVRRGGGRGEALLPTLSKARMQFQLQQENRQ